MNLKLLKINPQNRKKKNYKFIIRYLEDLLKNAILIILIIIISLFLFRNLFKKNKFYLKDFFNQNASVFLIASLLNKKSSTILFNIKDSSKIFSRFGFLFFIKNFCPAVFIKNATSISFKKKSDIYLNPDYFKFFDEKMTERSNSVVMPFYLKKNFYIHNLESKIKKLRENKKKFKIIFSGSVHSDWYEQFPFKIDNKKILNRVEIFKYIKKHYSSKILIISSRHDLPKLNNTAKKIIFIISDPDNKRSKQKILSNYEHMCLISQSQFFMCMPGTSMPVCYHLIESMLVGTVPILSYPNLVYPKLSEKNSIIFSNKKDLSAAINRALSISDIKYQKIRTDSLNYYKRYLSIKSFGKKILSKQKPLEVFVNFDHWSYDQKRIREGFPSLFKITD